MSGVDLVQFDASLLAEIRQRQNTRHLLVAREMPFDELCALADCDLLLAQIDEFKQWQADVAITLHAVLKRNLT